MGFIGRCTGTTIYALMPFNDKYLFYSKGGNLHFLDINNGLSLLGTLNMGVMNVDKYYDGFCFERICLCRFL